MAEGTDLNVLTYSRKVMGSRSDELNNFFSIYLILPAELGLWIYSASNRNEYRKHKKCFCAVKRDRCLGLTTSPPSVSRLSRNCATLNISQTYRPPAMAIVLLSIHGLCEEAASSRDLAVSSNIMMSG
jgi:hypothetical protein